MFRSICKGVIFRNISTKLTIKISDEFKQKH